MSRFAASAAIVLLAVVAYRPTLSAGFVWDDDDHFTENPQMTARDGLLGLWKAHEHYYPLTSTTWWMMRRLWGLTPWPYHLVNALLHGVSGVLLWRLLARLAIPGAWLAGAVFAVHPVHVQSVAWATELKNVQSGLFYLLSLHAWVRFRDAGGPVRRRWYAASWLAFVAAVTSKTSTVVLAPVLVLLDLWQRRRLDVRGAAAWLPYAAVVAAAAALTVSGQAGMSVGPEWDLTPRQHLVLAGRIVWFYLGQLLLPVDLAFVYPRFTITIEPASVWFPFIALCLVFFLAAGRTLAGDRYGRPTLAALTYFVVALGPVLGFFRIYYQRYSWVADHWTYLASMGAIAWGAAALAHLTRRLPAGGRAVLAAVLLAVLGTATWRQARTYRDAETLYRATLETNPDAWLARNNLAELLLERGEVEEPLALFERGVEQRPDDAESHYNLANALAKAGRLDEAIGRFETAIRLDPDHAGAWNNLGNLFHALGRHDEAIAHLERALQLRPGNADFENNLGVALAGAGRAEEAVARYQAALRANPELAEAENNLGAVLAALGRTEQAAAHHAAALRIRPVFPEAANNLGNRLLELGRAEAAIPHFESALAGRPDYPEAENGLGAALTLLGRFDEARRHYETALRLRPGYPSAVYNLGDLLRQTGRLDEAIAHFEAAAAQAPGEVGYRHALGRTLLQAGRPKEAARHLEGAAVAPAPVIR